MKRFFTHLWHFYFYFPALIATVLLTPVLLIATSHPRYLHLFSWCSRAWSHIILFMMGFWIKIEGEKEPPENKNYIFIANHTSILDILLMFIVSKKPIFFIGKKELAKSPLFGYFYKKTSILVDRNSTKSRIGAYTDAKKKLSLGGSICIFPEGGVPNDTSIVLDDFKAGAFALSKELNLEIVPFIFLDCKKRFPYLKTTGSPGILRCRRLKTIQPLEKNELKKKAYQIMKSELEKINQEEKKLK